MRSARRKRGRPSKFGRPSQVIALTLPEAVIQGLRGIDADLGWAIVRLFERDTPAAPPAVNGRSPEAALVAIGDGRSLIVVNRTMLRHLPGVHIIPLSDTRAFLALEHGRGMPDLELAVIDRLEHGRIGSREREALELLRAKLREWRQDRRLTFSTRAIIEVERTPREHRPRPRRAGR